jgi:hypothetical protein
VARVPHNHRYRDGTGDDRRRVQAHALLSSLNMLIETAGGFEYTAAQCREWMSHVGFRDIRTQPLDDVHTAVIGIKGGRLATRSAPGTNRLTVGGQSMSALPR